VTEHWNKLKYNGQILTDQFSLPLVELFRLNQNTTDRVLD